MTSPDIETGAPSPIAKGTGEGAPWDRYRLAAQAGERGLEGHRGDTTSPFVTPQSPPPRRRKGPFSWLTKHTGLSPVEQIMVLASALGIVATLLLLLRDSGPTNAGLYALLALVPLVLVVWILLRADRLAPLPTRYLLIALLWGGGVATAVAGIVNSALYSDFILYLGDVTASQTLAAVAVAPVSEEVMKGGGVVLVLLIARKYVVSVTNGIAVGGLVGAGFAFTENLIYFAEAHASGTTMLGITVFGRAVMSPFVHPMATSLTGLGVAAALVKAPRVWSWIWRPGLGLLSAMGLHALWNGVASLGAVFIVLYLLVELPLFILWLVWILRRPKKMLSRLYDGLVPYEATGWLRHYELVTICDLRARRSARRWARKTSKLAKRSMRGYLRDAGRLGLLQELIESQGPTRSRVLLAKSSLSQLISNREIFLEQGRIVDQGTDPVTDSALVPRKKQKFLQRKG